MSTERARRVGTFFGWVMLLVQALVLYRFVEGVSNEIDLTPSISSHVLWSRLAWLKAPMWQPPYFERYMWGFAAVLGGTLAGLWVSGARRWWVAWRAGRGR